ncbi:triacylglycerol lipase [Variovorax sp. YR216]|uniref:esterase/lipase family protein n=1 Tax=Variovorax sp. YR216 TaxID=1882828 RepID=UPI000896DD01|nr:alpha/beta hydrolase [Variovorax sp. YR216]SEB19013.1 PGAP1-like protein [Variovorax sp. YR216]
MALIDALVAPPSRTPDERRPSGLLLGLEGRALLEWATMPVFLPWLMHSVPRGDGHPVLVLPGLLADDLSTDPLRRFLRSRGYNVHGWRQGFNFGPRAGVLEALMEQLDALHTSSGRTVSLVGWSLGGIYAREMARAAPAQVRQVITLGSPFHGDPATGTHAWHLYRAVNRHKDMADRALPQHPPPVPTTSIYSRCDGVVGWGCSVERRGDHTDNIEVNSSSHMGMGVHPLVWYAVGDRLALPEGQWQHFCPRGWVQLLYPFDTPHR